MRFKLTRFVMLFWLGLCFISDVGSIGQEVNPVGPNKAKIAVADQPIGLPEIVVRLTDAADPNLVAARYNLRLVRPLKSPGFFVFEPQVKPRQIDRWIARVVEEMSQAPDVLMAAQNRRVNKRLKFVANDTFFAPNRLGGQWHLKNESSAIDANVTPAWQSDITGQGIVIGIVDDGLPVTHPDLSPNLRLDLSYDFAQDDNDPSPVYSDDNHGASVAGVAGARGGNSIGVSGAAPLASLAGLRIDFGTSTDADFADATLYLSESIPIKNHSYGYRSPFIRDPIQRAAIDATPGTIHCFAAGNGRGTAGQDSVKEETHNSPNVVNVAAIASDGTYSWYSSFGANVIVTAPSNGGLGITTTDRAGSAGYNNGARTSDYQNSDGPNAADYTATFGGTSSAAPLVAGALALALEVNPAMDYRMVNHLLVQTNVKVHPSDNSTTSDGGWRANGAGHEFNQNYGFGMIDASALANAARQFSEVTDLTSATTGTVTVNRFINENTPVTVNFNLSGDQPLEDLFVRLNVTHTYRGDLSAFLTSPSGFRSRLFTHTISDSVVNLNWNFRSVAFWGEIPAGQWTLELIDNLGSDSGTFNNFEVKANMGQLIPSFVLGDANGDGFFDFGDLEPFVLALTDPDLYLLLYPHVDPNRALDFDGDGFLTFGDIEGFVNALLG